MNARVILAGILLVGGAIVAVAGASPQATLTPTQAAEQGTGEASVKGMVEDVDRANRTFTLTDGTTTIPVQMAGPLPTAVEAGSGVVARGELSQANGTTTFHASEIQSGCPSKYSA